MVLISFHMFVWVVVIRKTALTHKNATKSHPVGAFGSGYMQVSSVSEMSELKVNDGDEVQRKAKFSTLMKPVHIATA